MERCSNRYAKALTRSHHHYVQKRMLFQDANRELPGKAHLLLFYFFIFFPVWPPPSHLTQMESDVFRRQLAWNRVKMCVCVWVGRVVHEASLMHIAGNGSTCAGASFITTGIKRCSFGPRGVQHVLNEDLSTLICTRPTSAAGRVEGGLGFG